MVLNKIFEIQNNTLINTSFKNEVATPAKITKTNDLPNDTYESKTESNKNKNEQTLLTTIGLTLLGLAGVVLTKKIYKQASNKLSIGIKNGEIREEFFNFIKKNDPDCKYFNNKKSILQLEKDMDEEKFLILKKLYRMNDEYKDLTAKRFKFNEITELLKITDKNNIEFLELLANKQHKSDNGVIETLSFRDIKDILIEINDGNKDVAKSVIDKYDISSFLKDDASKIGKFLKGINKDNVEIYKFLFETRKEGKNTKLNYTELKDIAEIIKEKNNPKTAEIILNLKENNGGNQFVYDIVDIKNILNIADDNNIKIYEKILNDPDIAKINNLSKVLNKIDEDICEEFILFSKLKEDQTTFIYSDPEQIIKLANLTSKFDQDKKDIFNKILEKYKIRRFERDDFESVIDKLSTADKRTLEKFNAELNKDTSYLWKLKYLY